VITPAFREAENLPIMYEHLCDVFSELNVDWEWIVVDDHSPDDTFVVLRELAVRDPRVRGLRLARNSGSHCAMACGLEFAVGDCGVVMAADLQDPPETIPSLLEKWRGGGQVVWAVRAHREGESVATIMLAKAYYWLMRYFVGMKELPSTGADFMLLDRIVIDGFKQYRESTISVIALITWMGFRQEAITYDKAPRLYGTSGWGFRRKLKLVIDSVTSFSYLPIRLISYFGMVVAFLGFGYAGVVAYNAISGSPVPGWSSLMVVVVVLGGIQMGMLGILGVYVWRTLDEARRRPKYLVEETTLGQRSRVVVQTKADTL